LSGSGTRERKSQAVAQKGKTFFQWHGREWYFFPGHTRDLLIKKSFSVIQGGERSFKGKMKTCREWHTGERKSQAVAQKGKTFFCGTEGNGIFFGDTQGICS
jgi:hypothetical protein